MLSRALTQAADSHAIRFIACFAHVDALPRARLGLALAFGADDADFSNALGCAPLPLPRVPRAGADDSCAPPNPALIRLWGY